MQEKVVSRECAECATETIIQCHTQTVSVCVCVSVLSWALAVGSNMCVCGGLAWNNYFLQLLQSFRMSWVLYVGMLLGRSTLRGIISLYAVLYKLATAQ